MHWLWGIFLVVLISWLIRENTKYIYELICGLSDDINDIKRKLGIEILKSRTPEQGKEAIQKYIREAVRRGDSEKHMKEIMGFWHFRKYRWYIDWCKEEFKKEHNTKDQ